MTRQIIGQWDLQEAITEQRTATRTAITPVMLRLESVYLARSSSFAFSSFSSSSSFAASPLTTRATNRQRAGAATDAKPSYRICIVEGSSVIVRASVLRSSSCLLSIADRSQSEIDTSYLHPGNSEVRIVPPTRATLLLDVDDLTATHSIGRGNGYEFSRSQTQFDSQGASQNGSHRVRIDTRNLPSHISYLPSQLTHTTQ